MSLNPRDCECEWVCDVCCCLASVVEDWRLVEKGLTLTWLRLALEKVKKLR